MLCPFGSDRRWEIAATTGGDATAVGPQYEDEGGNDLGVVAAPAVATTVLAAATASTTASPIFAASPAATTQQQTQHKAFEAALSMIGDPAVTIGDLEAALSLLHGSELQKWAKRANVDTPAVRDTLWCTPAVIVQKILAALWVGLNAAAASGDPLAKGTACELICGEANDWVVGHIMKRGTHGIMYMYVSLLSKRNSR